MLDAEGATAMSAEGATAMSDGSGAPRVTAVSGVAEDAVPSLFASASAGGTGIARALLEQRAMSQALAATPPLGVDSRLLAHGSPERAEHTTLHFAVEGVSLLVARALHDARLVSILAPAVDALAPAIVEPPGASEEVRGKVRAAIDALLVAHRLLVERGTERIAARDNLGAPAAAVLARDLALGLLPAATRTNVYLSGNARALASLCDKLLAHPLPEAASTGRALLLAARSAAPELFPHAPPSKMRASAPAEITRALARMHTPPREGTSATMVIGQPVRLVRHDKDAIERVALALAYEVSDPAVHAFALSGSLRLAKEPALLGLLRDVVRERLAGEPLPRAFEASSMTFELMVDGATGHELLRHRLLSASTQRLSCRLGFQTPEDLLDLGLADPHQDALLAAQGPWSRIEALDPIAAEYAAPLGYRVRSLWTLDLRELVHIVETRSAKDNPTRIRRIAHGLFRTAAAVLPWLRDVVTVDLD